MVCNLKRILFVWLILLNRTCQSIQCYQCNSLLNSNCTENLVNPKYLQECPKMYNACRKMYSAYYFKKPTEYVFIRECAFLYNEDAKCYKRTQVQTSFQQICECKNRPGCNNSYKLTSWNFFNILKILFITLFYQQLFT